MRLTTQLQHRLEQRMKLAPQIIQSIEILQLPMLDLQELIKQELEENPTLEMADDIDPKLEAAKEAEKPDSVETAPEKDEREDREDRAATAEVEAADAAAAEAALDRNLDENLNMLEALEREWKEYAPTRTGGDDPSKDKKLEAMQNTPARTESLHEHLSQQFTLLPISERARRIGQHLIYNINTSGYLKMSYCVSWVTLMA